MRVLGIETSCDETGIAIYDTAYGLLAHTLYSQIKLHNQFGGVVPELASRDHLRKINSLIEQVLQAAKLSMADINGIAYTKGPGLVGALMVGATLAKTLGFALDIPSLGVHHLEGHLVAPFLEESNLAYPFLALLVSGGHTQLINVIALGEYEILGDTFDDAVGEAFDKTGKLLGLGYPAGAALAKLAETGDPARFHFPRPMIDRPGVDFSFSGIKTFALNIVKSNAQDAKTKADIAAGFQAAIVDTLSIKCKRALLLTKAKRLVVAGGVGANLALRSSLCTLSEKMGVELFFPRIEFCTDNGAMIAYLGAQRLMRGEREGLEINVLPRWPLDTLQMCS